MTDLTIIGAIATFAYIFIKDGEIDKQAPQRTEKYESVTTLTEKCHKDMNYSEKCLKIFPQRKKE